EAKLLEARIHRHILLQQLQRQVMEFGPQGQRPLQILGGQRVLFHTDEMQEAASWCLLLEQPPGTEKVQPRAEARFADHQSLAAMQCSETLGQSIRLQE